MASSAPQPNCMPAMTFELKVLPVNMLSPDKNLTITCSAVCTINGDVHFDAASITMTSATLGTGYEWYVDSEAASIQAAIDAASEGDTINVAAGTYEEDIEIPIGKDNLELAGASGATIKGVDIGAGFENFDIMIKASGAKIHGFTIQGPDPVSGKDTGGMVIGTPDIEIYNNAFQGTNASANDDISQVIQTWAEIHEEITGIGPIDVDGLSIHDNTFTGHGTGTDGYEGIYINTDGDVGAGSISIADNVFTGEVWRGITVERSDATISGNTIITDWVPGVDWDVGVGKGWSGININDAGAVAQDAVTVTGNTIKGSGTGKGFREGIRIGRTDQVLSNISITNNTVQMNTAGIKIWNDGADGVVVNYNDISGNVTYGVQNTDTDDLDAKYNWWGDAAGPSITTNPYNDNTGGDAVSTNVDYIPWLIHTELASGWNIYSTPIALDSSCDTIAEALDIWTADSGNFDIAYYFDSSASTPAWASATSLTPLEAIYVKMSAAATMDVWFSSSYTAPPSRVMYQGWNLVGPAELYDRLVDDSVASALYGTGEAQLWGYSQVISPGVGQTYWAYLHGAEVGSEVFIPTKGYWVYMVNQGNLGGFTSTPIAEIP
ncbi:hypothetical protein ES703_97267 [subsurface metagenome]